MLRMLSMKSVTKYAPAMLVGLFLLSASSVSKAEDSYIQVVNSTGQIIKVAAPGGKPKRIKPGEEIITIPIEVTEPNGIDVKAWWVAKPRELCVIFVRYEGFLKVAGKSTIRCLGN